MVNLFLIEIEIGIEIGIGPICEKTCVQSHLH